MYYNNENIEADKASAKEIAAAMKELGWTIASRLWGPIYIRKQLWSSAGIVTCGERGCTACRRNRSYHLCIW